MFCSLAVLDPRVGHSVEYFLQLSLSSVILTDSSMGSLVHVLMMSSFVKNPLSVLSSQRHQDVFLHSFWESSFHSCTLLQATLKIVSIISLLSCKMWNRPVLLAHFLLRCPQGSVLGPWYPHFLLFSKPSPLRRWHSAFSFLPSDSLRLQHRSP